MRKKNFKILFLILFLNLPLLLFFNTTPNILYTSKYNIQEESPQLSFLYEWIPNGTAITTANENQEYPQIYSDGAGGAIITWGDSRSGPNTDIYAQRINSSGNVQWEANGTAICTASDDQWDFQICSDGAGGAVIVWRDYRRSEWDIYAQRINSSGIAQWIPNGTIICTASNYQTNPQICSDGVGGAIITWEDYRSGSNRDIYAQRINSSGNVQWTPNGTAICTANENQEYAKICSDGAGGTIITWHDFRSSSSWDIYAQRINSSGNVQWTPNGTTISIASNDQYAPEICSDGVGGAIITWLDYRSGSHSDIYTQRINSSGNIQWIANGTAICTASEWGQDYPQICSDGAGGAIITWLDYRSDPNTEIYAQRINSLGNEQWIPNGTAICKASDDREYPQICSDGAGGAIIAWEDRRHGSHDDIYAQWIDSNGIVQWMVNGTGICTKFRNQYHPQICSDGAGGAIITWHDFRSGSSWDIYAQRISDEIIINLPEGLPLLIIIIIATLSSGAVIGVTLIIWIRKKRKL